MIANIISDINFFKSENDKKPVKRPSEKISEYVEGKRILPPGTPFPGFWSNSKTPYGIEIMDNMSPYSPIQRTGIMKGHQLGYTAMAENVLGYWMDEMPAEILFVSATERLLEKWATKRLEPLIDSCGFRHKIYSQTENAKSRRSGDKIFTKEYVGGTLDLVSAQSASGLRSDSKRILIRDEIDGAPLLLRTGEGSWIEVSEARTSSWNARKKILDFSTPTLYGDSPIHNIFEEGDQRYYLVPCPLCGKHQVIERASEKSNHGLRADSKGGQIIQAYYLCEFCHEAIFNHQKSQMLSNGYWEATTKSSDKFLRTYHMSSLYSPVGMLSWTEIWKKYLKAQKTPDGMRSFVNLIDGMPYKETGARPKLENVIQLRGAYKSMTVPDGVVYLTMAVDVQRGSAKNPDNPARLELEVMGMGRGYKTWSVLYKRIEGSVDDPYQGAWKDLNDWATETKLQFKRKDGRILSVAVIFIDSGDGKLMDIVYRFCSNWQNTYPIKGFNALKKHKKERGDEAGPLNFRKYKAMKINEEVTLYEISTNYYKTHIYNNLKIGRLDEGMQRPGFCEFPIDYPDKYFRMLTAEEKRRDGSFHDGGRRNEALDIRVYNLCAADVYLDAKLLDIKAHGKNAGMHPADLQKITHKTALEILERAIINQKPS